MTDAAALTAPRPVSVRIARTRYLAQSIRLEESSPPGTMRAVVATILVMLAAALAWAAVTPVSEIAHAPGEVVPAGSIVAVQHLEGGIVAEILVREGTLVEADAPLLRLAPSRSRGELDQALARQAALLLEAERLRAFAEGREPRFDEVVAGYDGLKLGQRAALFGQRTALESQASVVRAQIDQRRSEQQMLRDQAASLEAQIGLLSQTLDIRSRLRERGLASMLVEIESRRLLAVAQGSLTETRHRMVRNEAETAEAGQRLEQIAMQANAEALARASAVAGQLAETAEELRMLQDRVERLEIRSPVRGLVKDLAVRTINAVIAPGQTLMEIVPVGEELVVEARVSPRDIGHVAPDQPVELRVSAYDFARFGAVPGRVRRISASTFVDEQQQPHYRAVIALDRDHVGGDAAANRIIPGMTVQAEIRTGSKTVLDYLLRPVSRGLHSSFRER